MLFTRTASVLRVTKNCLQRMHMLAGGHGRVHANVFLAGVLMRRFPSEVFGAATNETRLQQAAGSMLAAFDEMMRDDDMHVVCEKQQTRCAILWTTRLHGPMQRSVHPHMKPTPHDNFLSRFLLFVRADWLQRLILMLAGH